MLSLLQKNEVDIIRSMMRSPTLEVVSFSLRHVVRSWILNLVLVFFASALDDVHIQRWYFIRFLFLEMLIES